MWKVTLGQDYRWMSNEKFAIAYWPYIGYIQTLWKTHTMSIPYTIAIRRIYNFNEDQSTLVQVMASCLYVASHYLGCCEHKSVSPHGATRSQWVNSSSRVWYFCHEIVQLSTSIITINVTYKIIYRNTLSGLSSIYRYNIFFINIIIINSLLYIKHQ